MNKKLFLFAVSSLLVVLFDQIIKLLIISKTIPLNYIQNTGAGFGLFKNSVNILIIISFIVIGMILYYYKKIPENSVSVQIAAGLILGGAIGNLIDRIRLGFVIDFIDLKFWPSFNIADSAITIGAIIIIIYLLKKENISK